MGTIWIKEFTGGLDTRRMQETTAGGVLVKAQNGHISRGGEFEKRAAFVAEYTLPAGTIGLAATNSLYVFGSGTTPVGMPSGVTYQRLVHPSGSPPTLTKIKSFDVYAGKLYVVAEYNDGSILHYYDGSVVNDWYDGRARATFDVVSGATTSATAATGSFAITGGTASGSLGVNGISALTVNGVAIISASVDHTGSNTTTATAVANAINSYSSSPDYTASALGNVVTITAATTGTGPNGYVVSITVGGDATVGSIANMGGGAAAASSALTDMTVNGVSVIGSTVSWAGSREATATAIAAEINSHTSSPEYTAEASGTFVTVAASTTGSAANGRAVTFTVSDSLVLDPTSGSLSGGLDDPGSGYSPGSFVKTINKKMYSLSSSILHFSGIAAPTQWTTDNVGAGFIDLSTEASGISLLTAIAQYQNYAAIFSENCVIVEYVDPDPTLNRQVQVLGNTGTSSGKSVTAFGDNDLFFLDESGVRSLRARDSSNAASTTDVGVPIDSIIMEKLAELTDDDRENIIGLIEPQNGRFWLLMKDVIYVFSFFSGVKVSAWSTYLPTIINEDGDEELFDMDYAVVCGRRVFIRSGNTIYCYGGLGATQEYDATVAEAWLPYLDANTPAKTKVWDGVDAAVEGEWTIYAGMEPTNHDAEDRIATINRTTYNHDKIGSLGESSHISLRFRTTGATAAKLSAAVIHYEGAADEG